MKTRMLKNSGARDGVALIVCLGLLAVMTMLAVTFAIAMRIERLAARNFADGIRAKHMVQTAFVRAVDDIDSKMVRRVYPATEVWTSKGSGTAGNPGDLITDEVDDLIPAGHLRNLAESVAPEWITDIPSARVAFVVINTTGLIDINSAGNLTRISSTNMKEVDIRDAPEVSDSASRDAIVNEIATLRRFETIGEIKALGSFIDSGRDVETFQTFSYDPGPDRLFFTFPDPPPNWWTVNSPNWATRIETNRPLPRLGTRDAEKYLGQKFNINSITNYACYWNAEGNPNAYQADTAFMQQFYAPLNQMIRSAIPSASVARADDVAWNIVNYLDPDLTPHGANAGGPYSWLYTEGGESTPLINELVITEVQMPGISTQQWVVSRACPTGCWNTITIPGGPGYELNVELWYPFAPNELKLADGYGVQGWIFNSLPPLVHPLAVTNGAWVNSNCSFYAAITNMAFGSPAEFLVFSNKVPILFPTNSLSGGQFGTLGAPMNPPAATPVNEFWFLVRVVRNHNGIFTIVDESMGYDPASQGIGKRRIFNVRELRGYAVNDPRSNGQVKYWTSDGRGEGFSNGGDYPINQHTLGTTNTTLMAKPAWGTVKICDPIASRSGTRNGVGSGVPIYYRNGPMQNIGEVGHVFQSNLDDEDARPWMWFWRNINLMKADEGAMLADLMTVGDQRPPTVGLFAANSRVTNAWKTILTGVRLGTSITNSFNTVTYGMDPNGINAVIAEITTNDFVSFYDMFTSDYSDAGGGGRLADAFRGCVPLMNAYPNDVVKEDTFRGVTSLVSFRQNIFTLILTAQILGNDPDGGGALQAPVLSERRALATIYRDSYTGRHFTRNFRWLND